jgi:hypothetical protein
VRVKPSQTLSIWRRAAAGGVLALAASAAGALQVTLAGDGFTITYDDGLVGLFGTPVVVDDTVRWFPSGSPGFAAQSDGGFDLVNSTFALRVMAAPGMQIDRVVLREGGDYFRFGTASVGVSGQLRATPLPGSTLTAAIVSDAPFMANTPFDFSTRNWTAGAALNLPDETTFANVTVQNLLVAWVRTGVTEPSLAFVEKKDVGLQFIISAIPEPATYAMWLAGLAALGVAARRRSGTSR